MFSLFCGWHSVSGDSSDTTYQLCCMFSVFCGWHSGDSFDTQGNYIAVVMRGDSNDTQGTHPAVSYMLSLCSVWHGGDSGDTQAIHSAVVKLGLQYADYIIIGSNARATALLSAFQEVRRCHQHPVNDTAAVSLSTLTE